jgi:uncharacterized protein YukE
MSSPRPASSLAPFCADWVGGDIGGLRALAATLDSFVAEITDILTALNEQVSQLTGGDDGWHGSAAAAFTAAWRRDSVTAEALAAVIGQTASLLDALAIELARIENGLEEQAYTASRYGVMIGTDGRPPPVPADPGAASEQHWTLAYRQVYEQAMADAQQARQQAAGQLMGLYTRLEPSDQPAGQPELLPVSYPRSGVEPWRSAGRSQGCVVGTRGRHLRSPGQSIVALMKMA